MKMLNYSKILFPIDLHESSVKIVEHVKTFSERFDAEVHLAYVAKTNEYYREDECEPGEEGCHCEPGQIITRTVVEYVKKHCPMLKDPKVVVLDGLPEDELQTYIEQAEIDLVIMASSERSPVGKAVFGSVALRLARNGSVPVCLVHPLADKYIR